jgi:nitrogen fixation protein FixH
MSNNDHVPGGKPFTGWHMAGSLALFFGVIITVNLTMAYYANSTWSGLVVKNSYVASQEFNGKVEQVKAQDALGWKGSLTSTPGVVRWSLVDASAKPVAADAVTIRFRRPVTESADATLALVPAGDGVWQADFPLGDGAWIAVIDVNSASNGMWRETLRFAVSGGVIK